MIHFRNEDDYSNSEEAVRKRNYREKRESKEQADIRRAKDNAAKKKKKDEETPEQQIASKAANAARMRASRAAKKAAKLAEGQPKEPIPSTSKMTNAQNPGLEKFQKLQTPPKGLSHKGRLPHRNDGTLTSGSGLIVDTMSDYEKLREKNILERQQKFKSLFGCRGPFSAKATVSKEEKNKVTQSSCPTDTADPDFVANVEYTTRRSLPRRSCTQNLEFNFDNDSYAEKLEHLVKNGFLFANTAHLEYLYGSELMEEIQFFKPVGRQMVKKKRRKANLDRKSKKAKKSQKYRFGESNSQRDARLKVNVNYKQKLMRNENALQSERRKQIRRDNR